MWSSGSLAANRWLRIGLSESLVVSVAEPSRLAQARADKGREENSLRAMFPGSRAEVKARAHRGRVPQWTTGVATEFATPGCRPAAASLCRAGQPSGTRRSCSPSRAPRRSRRWPCRTAPTAIAEHHDDRAERLPARQRQMLLLDRGRHRRRRRRPPRALRPPRRGPRRGRPRGCSAGGRRARPGELALDRRRRLAAAELEARAIEDIHRAVERIGVLVGELLRAACRS